MTVEHNFSGDITSIIMTFGEKYPDKEIDIIGWEYDGTLRLKTIYTYGGDRYSMDNLENESHEEADDSGVKRYRDGKIVKNYVVDRKGVSIDADGISKSWITYEGDEIVGYVYKVFNPYLFIRKMSERIPDDVLYLFDQLTSQVKGAVYGFQVKKHNKGKKRFGLYVKLKKEESNGLF